MKRSLADKIEQYLKVLIERSENYEIEIQRAELAETFDCVPSQITYVIGTRFNEKDGYCTESRRGGKGFVRITRLDEAQILAGISRHEFFAFIDSITDKKMLSQNENRMLKFLIINSFGILPGEIQERLLQAMKSSLQDFIDLT